MRIAVDARPLAHPHTGIGRYTESLLKRLVQSGHQWFLYSDRAITPRFDYDDHVQKRTGNNRPGSPFSVLYSQMVFSRWARGDCVDLFWSPRHHLPLRLPRGVRSVVTVHDLVWQRFPETMAGANRLLERLLMGPSLRSAERIICVSDFTHSEVSHFYPQLNDRCRVVHEAAEALSESQEQSTPIPQQPFLLFVGTLEPRKNLPRLLQAFARLVQETDLQHQLLIVGAQGWGQDDIPALVRQHGLLDRVQLRGRISDTELQALYPAATALLMPSVYEGFGLPALEAMGHGVPVMAGRAGALPEVVGAGGVLVDPLSVQSMLNGMQMLCADERGRAELGRKALLQSQQFSWDRAADATLAVFEEAGNL